MADETKEAKIKYLNLDGLTYYNSKLKDHFASVQTVDTVTQIANRSRELWISFLKDIQNLTGSVPTLKEIGEFMTLAGLKLDGIETKWDEKQDDLISGINIKTINGESILGGGNVDILSDEQIATNEDLNYIFDSENIEESLDVISINDIAQKGKQLALQELYLSAGARYNNTDKVISRTAPWGESVDHLPKHYYLNGIGDITDEQMLAIYNESYPLMCGGDWRNAFRQSDIRTNLLAKQYYTPTRISTLSGAFANSEMEVIAIGFDYNINANSAAYPTKIENAFDSCSVKYVLGILDCSVLSEENIYGSMPLLKEMRIMGAKQNILLFASSPNISKQSLMYLIKNANPTKSIIVALHHDTYTTLSNDSDIINALTLKNAALASTNGKINIVCVAHEEETID